MYPDRKQVKKMADEPNWSLDFREVWWSVCGSCPLKRSFRSSKLIQLCCLTYTADRDIDRPCLSLSSFEISACDSIVTKRDRHSCHSHKRHFPTKGETGNGEPGIGV